MAGLGYVRAWREDWPIGGVGVVNQLHFEPRNATGKPLIGLRAAVAQLASNVLRIIIHNEIMPGTSFQKESKNAECLLLSDCSLLNIILLCLLILAEIKKKINTY